MFRRRFYRGIIWGIFLLIFEVVAFSQGQKANGAEPLQKSIAQQKQNLTAQEIKERVHVAINVIRKHCKELRDIQAAAFASMKEIDALKELGLDALPQMCEVIKDRQDILGLRILLIELVGNLEPKEKTRETLIYILSDISDDPLVRMKAVDWLPQVKNEQVGLQLVKILQTEKEPSVRFAIIRAMKYFKVPEIVPVLKDEFIKGDYLMQIVASHSLATQNTPEAIRFLQSFLQFGFKEKGTNDNLMSEAVFMHIATALGEAKDASSIPLLKNTLLNYNFSSDIRKTAAQALGNLGGEESYSALIESIKKEPDEAVLVYIGKALLTLGNPKGADECLNAAQKVKDEYVKKELESAASGIKSNNLKNK